MSLATRCTHCGTIFKIVQDQLKVSEGWVRCGRCNEIFNALPGLFDLEREPPPPRPKPKAASHAETTESAVSDSNSAEQSSANGATVAIPPSAPEPEQDWEKTAPIRPSMVATAREATATSTPTTTQPAVEIASAVVAATEASSPASAIENELPEAPPAAGQPTTEFDLDTSVAGYVDKPATVVQAVESLNLKDNPQPWLGAPPEADVPETDESDALDSRYLMPSTRERKTTKRRKSTSDQDFADAEFPDDAFLDAADDEWASGFNHSGLQASGRASTYGSESTAPAPLPPTEAAFAAGVAEANLNSVNSAPAPLLEKPTSGEDFVPERALEPPSKRQGKSGTRGRDPATQTPEFIRRAKRQAFWRHPVTRIILSLFTMSLFGLLGLQIAHQYRDIIAAHHPGMRPFLTQLCSHTGCSIKPPLRLDDLQVESATLVRANSEGPDSYRLAVVVHNKSDIDLAWPNVDVTLTDETGAVIARKAFSHKDAEWLDTADAKAEAAPRSPAAQNTAKVGLTPDAAPADRSTTLLWHLRAPDIKPAGYTAELFYP